MDFVTLSFLVTQCVPRYVRKNVRGWRTDVFEEMHLACFLKCDLFPWVETFSALVCLNLPNCKYAFLLDLFLVNTQGEELQRCNKWTLYVKSCKGVAAGRRVKKAPQCVLMWARDSCVEQWNLHWYSCSEITEIITSSCFIIVLCIFVWKIKCICLFIFLLVCWSACRSVCQSVCLPVCLCCQSVCLQSA